ncbi:VOC family protein [Pseudoalteromonas maricaloris]|uniref:VOC family protein n=1 Tax=Pseudoalteromonas maricaloris TaxID=184924 RepID=UPI003C22F90C
MKFDKVDHLAIAVLDLDAAIDYYQKQLGFSLDTIRDTHGKFSGMRSAVLFSGEFSVVLIKSLSPDSQVDRYISRYGPGVQHIAFEVKDIHALYIGMKEKGMQFSTEIIEAPGLRQLFTRRDPNTGMMHEFIERTDQSNFDEKNINQLFEQLEASGEF